LNLDTEEDDEIDIVLVELTSLLPLSMMKRKRLKVCRGYTLPKGLNGGHSGMDIHKGLGNANKIMNRLLFDGLIILITNCSYYRRKPS
jgi:dipeptidase D